VLGSLRLEGLLQQALLDGEGGHDLLEITVLALELGLAG
jgi:hypothetical protein